MAEGSSGSSCGASQLPTRVPSSLSSSSRGCVADLVRLYLPVRTLVQFKLVSKEGRTWCDENLSHIWKERRKNEPTVVYFPLTHEGSTYGTLPGAKRWFGVHQGLKEQHALPDLDFLPFWNDNPHFDTYDFEAASGGLLVVSKCISPENFVLIVCNPLSKKRRRLPPHTERQDYRTMSQAYDRHKPHSESVHTHLALGDLPNKYKVTRHYLENDVVTGLHTTYAAGAHYRKRFYRGRGLAYSPSLDLGP